jgi:hypothetical protein
VDAAYKLAAALANYDKEDYRSLKFLDIKVKETQVAKKELNKSSSVVSEHQLKLPRI